MVLPNFYLKKYLYYKFLESGELKLTLSVDKILRETNTDSYILDETKGEKLVLEKGTRLSALFLYL